MFFKKQFVAQGFETGLQLDAYHKAAAAQLPDGFVAAQFFYQVISYGGGVFHQMLIFDDIQNSDGSGAGQVVATESGAQHTVFGFDGRIDDDGADRETAGQALCHRNDVGLDTAFLVSEEVSGASHSALDLIHYQQRTVFVAGNPGRFQETVRRLPNAGDALDALYDDSCVLSGGQLHLKRFYVI